MKKLIFKLFTLLIIGEFFMFMAWLIATFYMVAIPLLIIASVSVAVGKLVDIILQKFGIHLTDYFN